MNKWNNKFRYQVASCWLFILRKAYHLRQSNANINNAWSYSSNLAYLVMPPSFITRKTQWEFYVLPLEINKIYC